jgi:hypothetical protein
MEQDIRWKQRFQNYEKLFHQLEQIMGRGELNDHIQRVGRDLYRKGESM